MWTELNLLKMGSMVGFCKQWCNFGFNKSRETLDKM